MVQHIRARKYAYQNRCESSPAEGKLVNQPSTFPCALLVYGSLLTLASQCAKVEYVLLGARSRAEGGAVDPGRVPGAGWGAGARAVRGDGPGHHHR